ncbi:MAG: DNA primase, partial [Saccharothrix sp.]|nr:DNA primase [Saccharothrix sp.]
PLGGTQARLGPPVDTRARGGYIVAAGSVTAAGRYTAVNRAPILPLPQWLVTALTPPPARSTPSEIPGTRADAYHRAALADEASRVRAAPAGVRRLTLLRAAARLGRLPGLPDTDIADALIDAATRHLAEGAYSRRERDRAISDGIAWGRHHPRPITRTP